MAVLIYSQSFCQKSAERKSPKKYFLYIVLMSGLGLEPWLYVLQANTLPTRLRRHKNNTKKKTENERKIIQKLNFCFDILFFSRTVYFLMVFSFLPKNVHFIFKKKANFVFVSLKCVAL